MAQKTWELSGEYMESCNCDYLCPCIFTNPQAPATHEHCYRPDGLPHRPRASRRHFPRRAEVRPGHPLRPRHVGRRLGVRPASSTKRRARRSARPWPASSSGTVGGPPQMIRDNLVSDFRGVEFRRIDFTIDGLRRATEIPGVLAFEIEGVASRNRSRRAVLYRQHRPPGQPSAGARPRQQDRRCEGFGLALSLAGKGNNGHFAPFAWEPDRQPVNRSASPASPLLGPAAAASASRSLRPSPASSCCAGSTCSARRRDMAGDGRHAAMVMPPKGAADLVLLLAMWWVMMIGMMLPSAAPMILTFAAINRAPPRPRPALHADGPVHVGLSPGLGRLQRGGDARPVGPGAREPAFADGHEDDQPAAAAACCSSPPASTSSRRSSRPA